MDKGKTHDIGVLFMHVQHLKKMKRLIPIYGFLILLVACKSTNIKSGPEFFMNDHNVNLYAFIGEKISVTEFDPNTIKTDRMEIDSITGDTLIHKRYIMDLGFLCKYKVIKNIFNEIKTDTVEFKAYDHYGRPGFENYENSILYLSLSQDSTHYFHQKYIFDALNKSSNGKWEGLNGESVMELFNKQKNGVFTSRKIFK